MQLSLPGVGLPLVAAAGDRRCPLVEAASIKESLFMRCCTLLDFTTSSRVSIETTTSILSGKIFKKVKLA